MTNRRAGEAVAALVAIAAVAVLALASYSGGMKLKWLYSNVAETAVDHEDPALRPLTVAGDVGAMVVRVTEAIATLPRWEVTTVQGGTIHATRTTSAMGFVDDIVITVTAIDETHSLVHVRSAARTGIADFGQNERNIKELFGAVGKE
jgi:uncharacterized protein (DUF1499 family)